MRCPGVEKLSTISDEIGVIVESKVAGTGAQAAIAAIGNASRDVSGEAQQNFAASKSDTFARQYCTKVPKLASDLRGVPKARLEHTPVPPGLSQLGQPSRQIRTSGLLEQSRIPS
jgi:hypothetical protein